MRMEQCNEDTMLNEEGMRGVCDAAQDGMAADPMKETGSDDNDRLVRAMMDYLNCDCTYFPPMIDDAPIMTAYHAARKDGVREGFVPVLVKVDKMLLECLILNADPDSAGAADYAFDSQKVAAYRKDMLEQNLEDGEALLSVWVVERKRDAEEDDLDWDNGLLGEIAHGYDNSYFTGYWNDATEKTYPLILAKIPVKHPWEVFAYLPFGDWHDCPDSLEFMAVGQYWFEKYGAVSAVMTRDELEFILPEPVPDLKALEVAVEQYALCQDVVYQGTEATTVGALADTLRQSKIWYFWWD